MKLFACLIMTVFLVSPLAACSGQPVAVKARGQIETGFGYGER